MRKVLRRLAAAAVVAGILALLGTAGASDRGMLDIPAILDQSSTGVSLIGAGGFLLSVVRRKGGARKGRGNG